MTARLPDETTILRFRHLLERHNLAVDMLRVVSDIRSPSLRSMSTIPTSAPQARVITTRGDLDSYVKGLDEKGRLANDAKTAEA